MLTASDEPPIHELQHLHWNCFLVKTLAFESTAKRNFFSNTGDALIFQSNDSDMFAAGFAPNNIPGFKIGVHRVPLGRVTIYLGDADHITAEYQNERSAADPSQQGDQTGTISFPHHHEFQAHATTGIYMPHYSVGPDLSLLNQKLNLCCCSNDPWFSRLDNRKQTARAQITAATRDWYESSVPRRRAKILRWRSFLGLPGPKCLRQCRRCLRNFLPADHFPCSIFQLPAIHGRRYRLLTSFAMQDNLPNGELLASPQS